MSLATAAAHRELAQIVRLLTFVRRRAGDLPQRHVATRLNVATGSLIDWEVGRDYPTMRHLIAWADLLSYRLAIIDDRGEQISCAPARTEGQPWEEYEMRRLTVTLRSVRMNRSKTTQVQVAESVGVSKQSLQSWELGKMYPRAIAMFSWVKVLGCSMRLRPADSLLPTDPGNTEP